MLTKNNLIKNDYLSNYDAINKYNLKNIYAITKLENIIIEFSLKKFLIASELSLNEEDSIIQSKAFIFFYLFNSLVPFINSNKLKIIKKQEKEGESYYSLKIILSNKRDIYNFIFSLFIENWHNVMLEDFKLLKKNDTSNLNLRSKMLLNCIIPVNIFSEMDTILNMISGINSKDFFLNISFLFKNQHNLKDYSNFIKNKPLFWISG